jgi:4'-phosphopantetheinyl transferase
MRRMPEAGHRPTGALPLPEGEIHLWWADIRALGDRLGRLERSLEPAERRRAARFRVEDARRRFVAGRGVLRELLARYSGIPPRAIRFAYGDHGKPALRRDTSGLGFNVSHSGRLIAVAVTRSRRVGVDIEAVRPILRAERLAARFFAPSEHGWLRTEDAGRRDRAYLHIWTSKEAVLKALGTGLSTALREVEVSPDPDRPPRLLCLAGDRSEGGSWSLLRGETLPRYLCVVAVRASGCRLVCRQYQFGRAAP